MFHSSFHSASHAKSLLPSCLAQCSDHSVVTWVYQNGGVVFYQSYPPVNEQIAGWKIPIFPGKYHKHGAFSMGDLLVYWSVRMNNIPERKPFLAEVRWFLLDCDDCFCCLKDVPPLNG